MLQRICVMVFRMKTLLCTSILGCSLITFAHEYDGFDYQPIQKGRDTQQEDSDVSTDQSNNKSSTESVDTQSGVNKAQNDLGVDSQENAVDDGSTTASDPSVNQDESSQNGDLPQNTSNQSQEESISAETDQGTKTDAMPDEQGAEQSDASDDVLKIDDADTSDDALKIDDADTSSDTLDDSSRKDVSEGGEDKADTLGAEAYTGAEKSPDADQSKEKSETEEKAEAVEKPQKKGFWSMFSWFSNSDDEAEISIDVKTSDDESSSKVNIDAKKDDAQPDSKPESEQPSDKDPFAYSEDAIEQDLKEDGKSIDLDQDTEQVEDDEVSNVKQNTFSDFTRSDDASEKYQSAKDSDDADVDEDHSEITSPDEQEDSDIASPTGESDFNGVKSPESDDVDKDLVDVIPADKQKDIEKDVTDFAKSEESKANEEIDKAEKSINDVKKPSKKRRSKKNGAKNSGKNVKPWWMFWKSEATYQKEMKASKARKIKRVKKRDLIAEEDQEQGSDQSKDVHKTKYKRRIKSKTKRIKVQKEDSPKVEYYDSMWGATLVQDPMYTFASINTDLYVFPDDFQKDRFSDIIPEESQFSLRNDAFVSYSDLNHDKPLFVSAGIVTNDRYRDAVLLLKYSGSINKNIYWVLSSYVPDIYAGPSDKKNDSKYSSDGNPAISILPFTVGYINERNDTFNFTIAFFNTNAVLIEYYKKNGKSASVSSIYSAGAFLLTANVVSDQVDEARQFLGAERFDQPYNNQTTYTLTTNTHGLPWYSNEGGDFVYKPKDNIYGFDLIMSSQTSFATYKQAPQDKTFRAPKNGDLYHYFDEWGTEQTVSSQINRNFEHTWEQIMATLSSSLEIRGVKKLVTPLPLLSELEGYNLDVGVRVTSGWLYTGLSRYDPYRRWLMPPTIFSVNLVKPDDNGRTALSISYTEGRYERLNITDVTDTTATSDGHLKTDGSTSNERVDRKQRFSFGISRSFVN